MYENLDLTDTFATADAFILANDRELYAPFFACAEQFCARTGVLIGGVVGTDLLTGTPKSKHSYFWELYAPAGAGALPTWQQAKALADELARVKTALVPARTVALQTNIKNREFTIYVWARQLFKIYALDTYRGVQLARLMLPVERQGYFTREHILCVSEEIQLIAIYRALYTPARLDEWPKAIAQERALYDILKYSFSTRAVWQTPARLREDSVDGNDTTGGADIAAVYGGRSIVSAGAADRGRKREHPPSLKSAAASLQARVVDILRDSVVVIGDHALAAAGWLSASEQSTRLQFITAEPIETIIDLLMRAINGRGANARSANLWNKFVVTYASFQMNLPDDFQIVKYILYLSDGKEQQVLADVFNSGQYEMIPYKVVSAVAPAGATFRIGAPYVLLRFLFIDVWTLKIVIRLSPQHPEYIRERILQLIAHIDVVRGQVQTMTAEELFQLTDYIGCYVNDQTAKKKLIKEIGRRYPIYYPARMANSAPASAVSAAGAAGAAQKANGKSGAASAVSNAVITSCLTTQSINFTEQAAAKARILVSVLAHCALITRAHAAKYFTALAVASDEESEIAVSILHKLLARLDKRTVALVPVRSVSAQKYNTGKFVEYFHNTLKHKFFSQYLPGGAYESITSITTHVDIGCGAGVELAAWHRMYRVRASICADVHDWRAEAATDSEYIQLVEYAPLPITDATADLITVFHALHHARDAAYRLQDIARMITPGGVLMIQDHDVRSAATAQLVDFEHFCYSAVENVRNNVSIAQLAADYPAHEPMYYLTVNDVINALVDLGFELIAHELLRPLTAVYGAVFIKRGVDHARS